VAGCCECGDERSGSCATELVSFSFCRVQSVPLLALHGRIMAKEKRSYPNASSLLCCEFYFIKELVMAKRRLQTLECKTIL
jgi:hypothetical protein